MRGLWVKPSRGHGARLARPNLNRSAASAPGAAPESAAPAGSATASGFRIRGTASPPSASVTDPSLRGNKSPEPTLGPACSVIPPLSQTLSTCPSRGRLAASTTARVASSGILTTAPAASPTRRDGSLREGPSAVGSLQRPKPRHRRGIVEIPLVIGDPDEIPNRRIGNPSGPQSRPYQLRRHARLQELADVACLGDRCNRGQRGGIERRADEQPPRAPIQPQRRPRRRTRNGICRRHRTQASRQPVQLQPPNSVRLLFESRPTRQKALRIAHEGSSG